MRRVVVTGMGLRLAARRRRRARLEASSCAGKQRAARASPSSRSTDLACQDRACRFRAATAATARSIPTTVLEPKEQRKIDDFILYGMAAADEAVEDSGWEPEDRRRPAAPPA